MKKIILIVSIVLLIIIFGIGAFYLSTNNLTETYDFSKLDCTNINRVLKGKNNNYLFVDLITNEEYGEMMNLLYPSDITDNQGLDMPSADNYDEVRKNFIKEHTNAYTLKKGDFTKVDLEEFNVNLEDNSNGEYEYLFYKAVIGNDNFIFPSEWGSTPFNFIPVSEENKWYVITDMGIWEINSEDLSATKLTSDEFEGKDINSLREEFVEKSMPLIWINNSFISPDYKNILYVTNRDCENYSQGSIYKINLDTKKEEKIITFEEIEYISGFISNNTVLVGESNILNIDNGNKVSIQLPDLNNISVVGANNEKLVYSSYEDNIPGQSYSINDINVQNGELVEKTKITDCYGGLPVFSTNGSKMVMKYRTVENDNEDVLIYDVNNNKQYLLSNFIKMDSNDEIINENLIWLNDNLIIIKVENTENSGKYVIFDTDELKVIGGNNYENAISE